MGVNKEGVVRAKGQRRPCEAAGNLPGRRDSRASRVIVYNLSQISFPLLKPSRGIHYAWDGIPDFWPLGTWPSSASLTSHPLLTLHPGPWLPRCSSHPSTPSSSGPLHALFPLPKHPSSGCMHCSLCLNTLPLAGSSFSFRSQF